MADTSDIFIPGDVGAMHGLLGLTDNRLTIAFCRSRKYREIASNAATVRLIAKRWAPVKTAGSALTQIAPSPRIIRKQSAHIISLLLAGIAIGKLD
jgi:hypothetical protein